VIVGPDRPASQDLPAISVVVIGHNEGDRLARCLESISAVDYPADRVELTYVDSNSTDGSCAVAQSAGAAVIRITEGPLSAARARNLGWRAARYDLVHFFDGDTEVDPQWFRKAVARIEDPSVGCVFGHCTECRPTTSIYMRMCNFDWHVPAGSCRYCGGIALFRREPLERLGGFCEQMVAGEEPELCYRLRQVGLRVWCLDEPMVLHDLDMTRFTQYWRRVVRSGWAYCVVAFLCRTGPERLWVRENLVNLFEVGFWVGFPLAVLALRQPRVLILFVALALLRIAWIMAKTRGRAGSWSTAMLYALHCQFSRIPLLVGQLQGVAYLLSRRPSKASSAGYRPSG